MGTNTSCVVIVEWIFQGQPKKLSRVKLIGLFCFVFDGAKARDITKISYF